MRTRRLLAAGFAVWALGFVYSIRALPAAPLVAIQAQPPAAPGSTQAAPTDTECYDCHDDDTAVREKDKTPVTVKPAVMKDSSHADVACVDCHEDTAGELPHAEDLKPVDCSGCHSEETDLYKVSAHARAREGGSTVAATCVSCHGAHDIKPQTNPDSRTHHLKIAETCASCHGREEIVRKGNLPLHVTEAFADSIHGSRLAKSGLVVAPTCSSCHGAHDIRRSEDPESRVGLRNTPNTCGTCHEGVARQFHGGVHAEVIRSGEGQKEAPACQTCHTAHSIRRADDPEWQLSVINQCGTCHAEQTKTFRDTFHGKVTALGSRSVAGCADCHGAHQVLPASDPRSPVAPANLVKTCGTCHEGASENFVKYDPHADKHDRERNPALYYTSKFMTTLLIAVFGMFGVHTALWFGKEIRLKRRGSAGETKAP